MYEELKRERAAYGYYVITRDHWWLLLIGGILLIIMGIMIFIWPIMTFVYLIYTFATIAILFGIVSIIRSFFLVKKARTWWVLLIEGVFGIAIGVMVFVWPLITTIYITYFMAAWLIILGISGISRGSTDKEVFPMINGILAIIIGCIMLFRSPLYTIPVLILLTGLFGVFRGISMIVQSVTKKNSPNV